MGGLLITLYTINEGCRRFLLQSCRCAIKGSTKVNSSLPGVGGVRGAFLINAAGTGTLDDLIN